MEDRSAIAKADEMLPASQQQDKGKAWAWSSSYLSGDLRRTLQESTDSAVRSVRSLQHNSSTHIRTLQDFIPQIRFQYKAYEDAFFKKVKDKLILAKEHPAVAGGIFAVGCLLLMRGPRRLLYRNTLGRLQSEEAQFVRAERKVKEFHRSVDLMKKESTKLLEQATLAEKEMKCGRTKLLTAGSQIQGLARSYWKSESQAGDLMDLLHEIPSREALKLRADVASMASSLRQQRTAMNKKINKIAELGVPV